MLYWLPATGASSARLYWESIRAGARAAHRPDRHRRRAHRLLDLPEGDSSAPSRRWAEQRFTDIRHWNELDRGGHFAAFEQPELFVDELRSFFRLVR